MKDREFFFYSLFGILIGLLLSLVILLIYIIVTEGEEQNRLKNEHELIINNIQELKDDFNEGLIINIE